MNPINVDTDWITNKVPDTISSFYSMVIIFGIIYFFLYFILKGWSMYHTYKIMKDEKVPEKEQDINNPNPIQLFDIAMKIQEKISNVTETMSGKYVSKEEMNEISDDINRTIDMVKEDLLKSLDQMSQDIARIKSKLTRKKDVEQKNIP